MTAFPNDSPCPLKLDTYLSILYNQICKKGVLVNLIKILENLQFYGDNIQTVIDGWNEKRKMPNEIAGRIHTAIMHMRVPQAVGIAKGLQLIPPFLFLKFKLEKPKRKSEVV